MRVSPISNQPKFGMAIKVTPAAQNAFQEMANRCYIESMKGKLLYDLNSLIESQKNNPVDILVDAYQVGPMEKWFMGHYGLLAKVNDTTYQQSSDIVFTSLNFIKKAITNIKVQDIVKKGQ